MPVYSARVSKMAEGKVSWERAKKLLLGAVDVVLQMKEKNTDGKTSGSSQTQDESDERTKRQRLFTQAHSVSPTNLVMYRLPHEKKITGLPQIYILTHSLRDLTSPSFCLQAEYAAHQGRREQVSNIGASVSEALLVMQTGLSFILYIYIYVCRTSYRIS